ncbi:MAG: hypothetical protein NTV34_16155 [Proteobacteria bacterium]|nr:hypothetical protein [Pseudomonadota bacterium]
MVWFPRDKGGVGSTGALVQANGRIPSKSGTLVYLTVENIEEALIRLTELNGKIERAKTS